MPDRRPTASTLTDVLAECRACNWEARTVNALALAAQHHDRTGHPTATSITRLVIYGTAGDLDRAREAAGQETMPL